MYAYIRGTLAARKTDRIIVEAGGIGYNIFFPASRIAMLGAPGSEVTVHTYTSVREDALQLYGFPSEDDLELFKQLIGVSGIGPKAAQSLLSELTAMEIRLAIVGGDSKKLMRAQGVAKKSAERIILDLKGKIDEEDLLGTPGISMEAEVPQRGMDRGMEEAVEALTALGYSTKEATSAVTQAAGEGKGTDAQQLLKLALRYL